MKIKDLYNYALEQMDESLLKADSRKNIGILLDNLQKYEITTNEMWFEYHFNDNVDLIFKVWDMKKLYKFYEENVYKKSRETKDLTDGLYYVLKK